MSGEKKEELNEEHRGLTDAEKRRTVFRSQKDRAKKSLDKLKYFAYNILL